MKLLSPAATVLAPLLLLLLLLLLLPLPSAQAAAAAEWEAVVGGVRVQALSPTLLRVEPIGPHGYENRTTFMVANRSSSNTAGLALRPGATPLELHTSHYTVRLRTGENATVIQAGTCEEPQRGVAAVDSVHDYAHRDDSGILVANRSACCAACDGSVTCLACMAVLGEGRACHATWWQVRGGDAYNVRRRAEECHGLPRLRHIPRERAQGKSLQHGGGGGLLWRSERQQLLADDLIRLYRTQARL
jgi:hypothetical protein